MLLTDIGKTPNAAFRRINHHLETNYGFKISENVSDKDLVVIKEQIEEEINDLKIKGDDAKSSPEISKRLLVLEGIKTLREFALAGFRSPDFEWVVEQLTNFVVESFRLGGTDEGHLDECVSDAMKHYRSSKYRFPDDIIEQRIREAARRMVHSMSMEKTQPQESMFEDDGSIDEIDQAEGDAENKGIEEATFGDVGKRASAFGGHAAEVPDTRAASHAMNVLSNPDLSLSPPGGDQVPMIRDTNPKSPTFNQWVEDPFARQNLERRKGRVMKEHANLVKNLRRLLETEVSQAEVMMAAKGFAQELQEMVEKIGRLQNEDLPPVTDQMRETYGMPSASAFQTQIYGALQGVMDSLYTAKGQVDDAVENMAQTGQVGAETDMDKDIGMDTGMDDTGMDDTGMDNTGDLDNIDANLDTGDEFGAEDGEEPLGRSKKMESMKLRRKVIEMKKLVEKARKLKESRG